MASSHHSIKDMAETSYNGNGKNGLFLKVMVGVVTLLATTSIAGMVKLYRDVGVLQEGTHLQRQVDECCALARSIDADRHQRTIILQGFREDIADLKQRIDRLERRRP